MRIKRQDNSRKVKSLVLESDRPAFASWLYRRVCCPRPVKFLSLWFLFCTTRMIVASTFPGFSVLMVLKRGASVPVCFS